MQWLLGAAQAVKEVVPRGTFEVAGRRPDSRTAAGQPDSSLENVELSFERL